MHGDCGKICFSFEGSLTRQRAACNRALISDQQSWLGFSFFLSLSKKKKKTTPLYLFCTPLPLFVIKNGAFGLNNPSTNNNIGYPLKNLSYKRCNIFTPVELDVAL
jgi:hypothetical protein